MNTTPQPKQNLRFVHWDEPLPRATAKARRKEEIKCLKVRIDRLREELSDLRKLPLPTTVRRQRCFRPGEPGYDEAPDTFNPEDYQGVLTWMIK